MKKRIISIMLLICIFMTFLPVTALAASQDAMTENAVKEIGAKTINSFGDVSESDWFYSSVMYVLEHGIFEGTGDNTFSPKGAMTRGMYVTVMGRFAGVDPSKYKRNASFADVDKDMYYAPYVVWAFQNKITDGIGNNNFDPNGTVTREQMAVFTIRYFNAYNIDCVASPEVTTTPKDITDVSGWAKDYVLKLWAAGLLKGDDEGNFKPRSSATRAEVATFSMRTNEMVVTQKAETATPSTTNTPTTAPTTVSTTAPYGGIQSVKYTVAFHSNGGGTFDSTTISSGNSLGELPLPKKDGMIFLGWFTDEGTFLNGVSADTKVNSNMELYANYIESNPVAETDENTTTSVKDVASDYKITVISSDISLTADDVKAAITYKTITEDESEFSGISITGSAGLYTIAATNGYNKGCSYALTLNDEELTFKDESSSVRTFNLTVKMPDPVQNLQLNSKVNSIPVSDIGSITQNNQQVGSIFAPLYKIESSDSVNDISGTFIYSGDQELAIGDNLAIYEGTAPEQRVATDDYTGQNISYVTVTGINGSTISYGSTDAKEVLFIPDVLPVNETDDQDGYANNNSITILISKMTYTGDDFADMGLNSSTTVDSGDFMAFYAGSMDTALSVTYAKISSVSTIGNYYVINYNIVTKSDLMSCMDISSSHELNYNQLSEAVNLSEVKYEIKQQVQKSGFAKAAANYLVSLAQADDDTRDQVSKELGIKNFSVSKEPNSVVSLASSEPEIDVVPHISSNLEHFSGDGMHCDVTVTCVVDLGDGAKITVSGTFVEEYKVTLSISSKTIWKWKHVIFYCIDEYKVTANVDLYNYTYLSLNMDLAKDKVSTPLKIKDSIKDLRNLKDNQQANKEVQRFYDLYKQMITRDHSYFDLFNVQICDITGNIDPLNILVYGMKVSFDVSLDADVSLDTEFGYEKGTRFNFTLNVLKASATSTQTDLEDEQYNFSVYAMGTLGIKAGIELEISVGLFSTSLDSVGISAEVGAYWQIWGFLYYELEHKNKKTTTESGGGCYMELGIYLTIKLNAQVCSGLASTDTTIFDDSWPLWSAGSQYYTYDFNYVLTDNNDQIILKGDNHTYNIPSSVFNMAQMDFKTGDTSEKKYSSKNFTYNIKDDSYHAFAVSKTGVITVKPPDKSDIAEATIVVTWNDAPLAFTSAPISRTFSLIWDNLDSSYVIGFDTNGGKHVSSIRGAYRSAISLPTPTRAGYIFEGWYTDNDTFKHAFTENRMPAANYIIYAKWTAGTADYTVRHYQQTVDGSSLVLADEKNLFGTTDSNVTTAVKSYTGFISPATKTVTISGDGKTIVNYLYLRNSYTLTFDPNNSSENIIRTIKYGVEITAPSLHRAGYDLTGWDTPVAATMPAQDLYYTAQWSINTYTITCDLAGGSVESNNPGSYTVESDDMNLINPTKTGYIFAGWTGTGLPIPKRTVTIITGSIGNRYYSANWKPSGATNYSVYHYREDLYGQYTILEVESLNGTTGTNTAAEAKSYIGFSANAFIQKLIEADGSTSVEIYYPRNSYTLTFDANGGTGGSVVPVKYGAAIIAPNVTKQGYTFAGWSSSVANTMPAQNATYTALWTENSPADYSVEHYQQNISDNNYTLTEDENLSGTTGATATASEKSYTGFAYDSNASGTLASGTIAADGSLVLKLYYTRNSYMLTFDADGGAGGSSTPVKYGSEIAVPTVTKTGYTLTGWSPAVASTMPAQDTTYTAQWTEGSGTAYKVEHYQQNVSDNNYTLAETENLSGTTDATATATAKSYTGFTYDSNVSGTVGTGTIVADGSLGLKLYYTRNSYTLTFDANGGTGGSSTQVKYGAAIEAPTVTKTGYTFANWAPAEDATMPAQNTTYTAQWTANNDIPYSIEHYQQNIYDNNYGLAETENLSGTTDATATATVKSYTGFTYDINVSGTVTSGIIVADGSLILKLYYTRNSYTLTFDANGGTGGSSTQVKYDAAIAVPTVTKTGYTFANWLPAVDATMPAQNTTYSAQWTESSHPFGAGTLEDPYLIASSANLKWVSENNTGNTGFSGKYFKQTADIDMSPTTLETWIPIGGVTNKFNGTYDGNGYSVENLCINTATIRQGLFGVIGDIGTVMDLGVTSVDITCSAHNNTTGALTGALVGTLYGSVLRCYSTGTVSGDGNIGGLVGYSYGGTLKDSYSTCTVLGNGGSVETSWDQVGGLLGKLALVEGRTGSVSNCYATGNEIAQNHDQVGGLVGEIDTNQEVYSSFATGTATGNTNVGGFCGVLQGPMYNSYTTSGTFKGSSEGTIIGGIIGVTLSWFMDISNFTTPGNWHETHQWDFVNTWAINPSINYGLPYLKKSKLGR